jgi:hypothetical protein
MKNNRSSIFVALLMTLAAILHSCKDWVEIPESKNQIESNLVFSDSVSATSALQGIYVTLGAVNTRMKNLSVYTDEYNYTSNVEAMVQFNKSDLLSTNNDVKTLWTDLYSVIYQSNAILTFSQQSATLSLTCKAILAAESKFLRAYANFYLVNLYGKIPLILTVDVNSNRAARQADPQQVYEQMISDLTDARTTLGNEYKGVGKVRANKLAASALLARIYLYQGKWMESASEASQVINSGLYNPLPKAEDVFLSNSREVILQFWSANGFLTDAAQIIPASAALIPGFPLTEQLYNAYETTDQRKSKWIGTNTVVTAGLGKPYWYMAKYKNRISNTARPEYVMGLRLAEQYLIRAEAFANQDLLTEALSDLNVVRTRAGLSNLLTNLNRTACLNAIHDERRLELFGEWGHRFLDLKRNGNLDQVLIPIKSAWRPEKGFVLPIPSTEIIYNPNLIQNNGY